MAKASLSRLASFLPFLQWWPLVNRSSLRADFVAGLTGAVIAIPQGVAFAIIAGLPPEFGLYSAMVIPVITALFGSSYQMISGPTTPISLVVFAALSGFAEPGSLSYVELALTLAFLTGLIQLVLGLVRMGTLVNFVSHSVVIGFTAGAALLIMTSQLPQVLGLSLPRGLSFLDSWGMIFQLLPQSNGYIALVGGGTLLTALLVQRFAPRLPYLLIAMVVGGLISWLIDGPAHGVALIQELPRHLPSPSIPDVSPAMLRKLAPKATALALLGLIEAVSIARAIATQTQQRIDGNQEFIGQGLANLIGSFFSCYPASGSFTRSGVNQQAGAKTPMAAIFSAALLALLLLFIAPLMQYLPLPAMGGLILLVGYRLIDFAHIRQVFRTSRQEFLVLLFTFLSSLLFELEFAIYVGVILSLIFYLQRTSHPNIVSLAPDPNLPKRKFANTARVSLSECPQLSILRIDGSLFFGAVDHVATALREWQEERPEVRHLLLVADGINFLDLAGADFLLQESRRWRSAGGDLYLSGLKQSGRDLMREGKHWEEIGSDHFFWSKEDAISHIFSQLDREICASCTSRIFRECGHLP